MSIVVIDASADSLTVSWPDPDAVTSSTTSNNKHMKNSTTYCLQYRRHQTSSSSTNKEKSDGEAADSYETLSNSLHTTLVRKKNLLDPDQNGFIFRVRKSTTVGSSSTLVDDDDHYEWMTHTEPFYLLTKEQESKRMAEAPSITYGGTNASLRISWNSSSSVADSFDTNPTDDSTTEKSTVSYEIQMRENVGGVSWTTIASMYQSTEVRKKNLTSLNGYQFRIRPSNSTAVAVAADTSTVPFSPPSESAIALSYNTTCAGLQRLFSSLTNQTLLSNYHSLINTNGRKKTTTISPSTVPVAETLGGKEFILLYASAHWCGPCRQYTPKLTTWYQQQVEAAAASDKNESPIEIVFVSADHDAASFRSYFSSMPWTAIDYDDSTREQLTSYIRVTGIPRLAVLNGRTGTIIEDNAVNKPLDIQRWRKLVSK